MNKARRFYENERHQIVALRLLRKGAVVDVGDFRKEVGGSEKTRLAPAIDILKNSWGFTISCHSGGYRMPNPSERPTRCKTTPEMKDAYYKTWHWQNIRQARFVKDGACCVVCKTKDFLQCHHITYKNLFCESLDDLLTVCDTCHGLIHDNCKLAFPTGLTVSQVERLGITPDWEPWLLPPQRSHLFDMGSVL